VSLRKMGVNFPRFSLSYFELNFRPHKNRGLRSKSEW
jgi:hypothetical protein